MLRGGRGVLAALAGLAALFTAFGWGAYSVSSNYSYEERHQPYRYAADKPPGADATLPRDPSAQSLEYRTPCEQPKGHDESDLCAQWRSAKAAENSAFWAKWGFWIAVVGSIFLLWQINLTRRAVEDTGEATEAMKEANAIARANSELQLRAYLDFDGVVIIDPVVNPGTPNIVRTGVTIKIKNFGITPARQVAAHITIDVMSEALASKRGADTRNFYSVISPGDYTNDNCRFDIPSTLLEGVVSGKDVLIVHVSITYEDAFGKTQTLSSTYSNEAGGKTLGYVEGSRLAS